jgi:tetratricopeptide (TPR) repeat protein
MPSSDHGDATLLAETQATGPSTGDVAPSFGATITAGARLGRYRIERRLGAGGMGEVFAATRLDDEVEVALKILGRASATHLYRFKREFRALADVAHRNLIRLHELVVPEDGAAFFTMELIEGESFTDYVRGPTPSGRAPSIERLERALRQLALGITELHELGCVHRDLKPSNVLVDRSGRVVILDFGLVSELDSHDEGVTHDGQLLGTPAYMAPEQAMSGKAGPAADSYALGVMLYECLTGRKPFTGSAMRVMMAKQDGEIPDPGAVAEGLPALLRSLCMKLLAPDPELRPTGREVLALLGDASATATSSSLASLSSGDEARGRRRLPPFRGRDEELARLRTALRDVQETRSSVTVLVHGPSGCGKSALLAQFLAKVRGRRRALVLSGRCLERESVPYKGVDAVVDALSLHLRRLPPVELAALQPRHAAAMVKLFPVLADVWEQLGALQQQQLDAGDLRRLGLRALRELVVRLCDRAPLLVCIDDFQWADIDSVQLLAALLRPPDPPAMLLVLGFRTLDLEPTPALRELRDPSTLAGRDVRELEIGPLDDADALTLAVALLGDRPDPARAEALVDRARGNPLLLTQLALGASVDSSTDLDEILGRRVAELDAEPRRLLTIVALAGRPIPEHAVLEAAGAEAETIISEPGAGLGAAAQASAVLDELIADGLLIPARRSAWDRPSSAGVDDERVLELAHGRLRALALAELEPAELTGLHLQLAAALERLGADPETLAEHYAEAGERERAAEYTERGAIQAAEALAFARAVELYRRTIELLPEAAGDARRRALKIQLAEQLTNLGHTGAAGDVLLELAATAEPGSAAGYRRRAVTALARCGRIDEAIEITRELLDELGEPMPRGHWSGFAMFLRERLRLWLRGERFEPRDESEIPVGELARLDTLIAASTGLSTHEVILTQALGSRALRLAFEAGDPRRLGLLLSYRFVIHAGLGQFERAGEMAVHSREIAALADDPEIHRSNDLSEAVLVWFMAQPRKAQELFGRILARAEDEPLADWIRSFATVRYAELCMTVGDVAEFRRAYPRWAASARARGNLHELASVEALATTISIYYGELDEARRHIGLARASWKSSRYTFTDVTLDLGHGAMLLGAGELDEARRHIDAMQARVRSSGIVHFRAVNELVQSIRARCLISQLLDAPANRELFGQAQKAARPHRRTRDPIRVGEALTYQAALHSLGGEREAARQCWRKAIQWCERHDLRAHLAAVRLRLARVTRGREASELETLGLAYLNEQGITRREHFVDILAPARAKG